MKTIRSFALAAAVAFGYGAPAGAMAVGDVAAFKTPAFAPAALLFASPRGAAPLAGADAAAEAYFGYDAVITLGALALAGGAMSAFAAFASRRRKQDEAEAARAAWRASVLSAVGADLALFTQSLHHAA